MSIQISEELQIIIKKISSFMDSDIIPLEEKFLSGSFDTLIPALNEKRDLVKQMGLWAPHIPKELGGVGLSLSEFAHISERLARTPLGHYVFNCQAPDIGNMEILLHFGTDAQKERFLHPLIKGDIRSCFAMTEPEHPGSNPTWMSASAVKDGDDYVINGHKWFATAADGADFAVVMAVTNPDAESPHQRASQILVPTDTPGFVLVKNISVMGHVGIDYFSHGEIRFENCRVPQSNLLGAEGAGFSIAQERLGPGRIHHCMRWIGISERAFDLMCEHAVKREVAPDRPLATRQLVQSWIAESRAEINAARLMVLDAAEKIDAESAYAARDEISLIKFYVAGIMLKVLDRAIQTHGALGMTDYTPLAFWYAHERAARIYDGADEVHKISVAKRILKSYSG